MQSFSYETKKARVQVRRCFEVPEDVLTDPDELRVAHAQLAPAEVLTIERLSGGIRGVGFHLDEPRG